MANNMGPRFRVSNCDLKLRQGSISWVMQAKKKVPEMTTFPAQEKLNDSLARLGVVHQEFTCLIDQHR